MQWNPVTHYQDEAVAERYDRERFSSLAGKVFNRLEQDRIVSAFRDVPKGTPILDLPCGTGRLAEALLEAGHTVVGADISDQMLGVARRRLQRFGARFTTRVGDARSFHDKGERFGAALCARVLMHFPLAEQIAFLRGVAQATSGPVVITQSYSTPYHRLRRWLKRLLGHQAPANYPITERELQQLLDGAGLREIRRLRLNRLVSEAIIVVAEHR